MTKSTTNDIFGERDTHPSYGVIQLTKVQGNNIALVGSPLRHHGAIHMTISTADLRRDFGKDYFSADKIIADLCMSEHQWAEFVSSFGMGSGIPVTFRSKPAEPYKLEHCEPPPYSDHQTKHRNDVAKAMADAKLAVSKLSKIVAGIHARPMSQVKKADIEELRSATIQVVNWLSGNLPFVEECFEKAMEKTVASAKSEVVGFVTSALIRAGIEHLQAQAPMLAIEDDSDGE